MYIYMKFHQLNNKMKQEEIADVKILIGDVKIDNGAPKSKIKRTIALQHSSSMKIEFNYMKSLFFYFQKLKTELKVHVSINSHGSLNFPIQ